MKFDKVYVSEGNAYEVPSEDGPKAIWDYYVDIEANGTRYRHSCAFGSGYDAELLANKVEERGEVNLEYWYEIGFPPSYALGEVDEVLLMDEFEIAHYGY